MRPLLIAPGLGVPRTLCLGARALAGSSLLRSAPDPHPARASSAGGFVFDRRLAARITSVPATARRPQIRTRGSPESTAPTVDPHSDQGQRDLASAALTAVSPEEPSSWRI